MPYTIALIQPYDAYLGPTRRTDKDLELLRVGMKPRASSEFISVLSIIRGAVLIQDFRLEKQNEFIVVDVIDSDMFLCVRNMRQNM